MYATANIPNPAGYAGRVVTKPPEWHTHVVLDLLFNNLATGLFLAAAVCELAMPMAFSRVTTWAYPVALGLLLIDLLFLVLDLGDPLRFHHMLRVFKPSSPMSLGTWFLTAYSLFPTTIVAVEVMIAVGWMPSDSEMAWWVRKLAVAGGIPFAFGSAAYKGVLFSITAQPGWKDARWFGAYLINSAILLGTVQLLVIAELLGEPQAAMVLRPAAGLLIVLNVVALAAVAKDLSPALAVVHSRGERSAWATAVGIATAFQLGVLIVGGLISAIGVLVLTTLVCLIVRSVIVKLPHRVARP